MADKHVHSFGPRGRGRCACGMTPDGLVRNPASFRPRVREAKIMLEMLEMLLDESGYREAAKRVYDARLRLSEAETALPESAE